MNGVISVIGSLNMDLVVSSKRIPEAGETIAGTDFRLIPGGKGANQAVAASRFGAETNMIGCVGSDIFGSTLIDSIENAGVCTEYCQIIPNASTGTATIIVEENGVNRIIIVPGTNACVSSVLINDLWPAISKSSLILMQHEIPLESVAMVLNRANQEALKVILNPAPFYPIPSDLFEKIDYLILNEVEGTSLSGVQIDDVNSAYDAAQRLRRFGMKTVIITLGAKGSVYLNEDNKYFIPVYDVDVIDTTAAGDIFVGCFAAAILERMSEYDALLCATAASNLGVTKLGAQTSIPTRCEIETFIKNNKVQRDEICFKK